MPVFRDLRHRISAGAGNAAAARAARKGSRTPVVIKKACAKLLEPASRDRLRCADGRARQQEEIAGLELIRHASTSSGDSCRAIDAASARFQTM